VQGLEDVAPAHLLEPPQQVAGVIEHDPRVAALLDQLGQQVGQAAVALGEGFGVVVVALSRVLKHVLEMGDQRPVGPGGDGGLVHVQGTGKGGVKVLQLQIGVGQRHGLPPLHQGLELGFTPGDRRPDGPDEVVHGCRHGSCRQIQWLRRWEESRQGEGGSISLTGRNSFMFWRFIRYFISKGRLGGSGQTRTSGRSLDETHAAALMAI
jgi:hypothetical protein